MNKKGLFPLLIGMIVLVVAVLFFIPDTIKYMIIGVGLITVGLFILVTKFMNQNMNRQVGLVVGIIIVIGIIVMSVPSLGKLGLIPQAVFGADCVGGNVMGIQNVKTITLVDADDPSNNLQKDVIRVVFSTIESAECLDIELNANDIQNKLGGDYKVTNRVLGDIAMTKKEKVFTISEDDSEEYFKIGVKEAGNPGLCTDQVCIDDAGLNESVIIASLKEDAGGIFSAGTCLCFFEDRVGVGGIFDLSESLDWEVNVIIGNDEATFNQDISSGKVGNNAFVKWGGNLASNDNFGNLASSYDAYRSVDTGWIPVFHGTYEGLNQYPNDYVSTVNLLDDCDTYNALGQTPGTKLITQCVGISYADVINYNSKVDEGTSYAATDEIFNELLIEEIRTTINPDAPIDKRQEFRLGLRSPIVYPQFTMDIAAVSVGIVKVSGKPDVTCPVNFNMVSGQQQNFTAYITNIGDFNGSFQYSIDCPEGTKTLQPSPPKSILKDETLELVGNFGYLVEGVIGDTETTSCTLFAQDINSLVSDTCTFTVTSEKKEKCTTGSMSCSTDNSKLLTCLEDGNYSRVDCAEGCILENSIYKCKTSSNVTVQDATSRQLCLEKNDVGESRYEWVEGVDYPWYEFWKKDVPGYCKDSRLPYVIYITLGILGVAIIAMVYILRPKKKKGVR